MEDDTTTATQTDDRTYETPQLTVLGTVSQLTSEQDSSETAK
jgi:hypothetical protein